MGSCTIPHRRCIAYPHPASTRVPGVKQKVLGAQLAGISRVVLPRANQRDVEDIPAKVRRAMSVVYVDTVRDWVPELAICVSTAN